MGNLALAEELAGSDELNQSRKLEASESEPEEENDEDGEEEHGGVEPETPRTSNGTPGAREAGHLPPGPIRHG